MWPLGSDNLAGVILMSETYVTDESASASAMTIVLYAFWRLIRCRA